LIVLRVAPSNACATWCCDVEFPSRVTLIVTLSCICFLWHAFIIIIIIIILQFYKILENISSENADCHKRHDTSKRFSTTLYFSSVRYKHILYSSAHPQGSA